MMLTLDNSATQMNAHVRGPTYVVLH